MVNIVKVEGFEAFQAKVAELAKTGGDVFVMFSGSKVWKSDDPPTTTKESFFKSQDSNGASWCPDCVVAEPVVNQCMQKVSPK